MKNVFYSDCYTYLNEAILFLCNNNVLRFFRKLRSVIVEIEFPDRSTCSRWTFWLRFSIVLILLLAKLSQVNKLTSWKILEKTLFQFVLQCDSFVFKWHVLQINQNINRYSTLSPSIVTMLLLDRSKTFKWWSFPTWNIRINWLFTTESWKSKCYMNW